MVECGRTCPGGREEGARFDRQRLREVEQLVVKDALAPPLDVGQRRSAQTCPLRDFPLRKPRGVTGAGESLAEVSVHRLDPPCIRRIVIHANILPSLVSLENPPATFSDRLAPLHPEVP